ncbi:hypothetical protein M422DRAFT_22898 [Sphaerobolus stellatus SS14]|nr:hypothetical protein M422DRAFT_22898 [Sphaerobolus stellatus SS14]
MDSSPREPPLTVWILNINRQIHKFEILHCMRLLDEKPRERARKLLDIDISEAFRFVMSEIFPRLVIRKKYGRDAPKWWTPFSQSKSTGKRYIVDPLRESRVVGFSTGWSQSIVAIAHAYGRKSEVVNIGLDVMQVTIPGKVSITKFVESYAHKLTRNEEKLLDFKLKEDVILRRLCILLTLKAAYVKAVGQTAGFDYGRIDCNIPEETLKVDGKPVVGWEFRLFKANLGVERHGVLLEETYQCSTAMYRGSDKTVFIWEEPEQEMIKWMSFMTVDNIFPSLGTPATPPALIPKVSPVPARSMTH